MNVKKMLSTLLLSLIVFQSFVKFIGMSSFLNQLQKINYPDAAAFCFFLYEIKRYTENTIRGFFWFIGIVNLIQVRQLMCAVELFLCTTNFAFHSCLFVKMYACRNFFASALQFYINSFEYSSTRIQTQDFRLAVHKLYIITLSVSNI